MQKGAGNILPPLVVTVPMGLSAILLWCTNIKAKKLNEKFQQRFGVNSAFSDEHPGVYRFSTSLATLALIMLFFSVQPLARIFLETQDFTTGNYLGPLVWVILVAGQGLLLVIIVPWTLLMTDRRLRRVVKASLRELKENVMIELSNAV